MTKRIRPEPCSAEAKAEGCTCFIPTAGAHDLDPPEPKLDKHCPLHGWARDPDDAYDEWRERRDEEQA